MDALQNDDVPYGDDWDSAAVAAGWAEVADQKRPWRSQIRDHIAGIVATLPQHTRVLELGSGPGLLARRVLDRCPSIATYTLLDFSEHMLGLSRERLVAFPAVTFVLGTFKSDDCPCHVGGPFDCVLAMQSVHELRHKRHATRLYEQIYQVLSIPGSIGDLNAVFHSWPIREFRDRSGIPESGRQDSRFSRRTKPHSF